MKFPIRTGLAWELRPKRSHSERREASSTHDGWYDDDYDKQTVVAFWFHLSQAEGRGFESGFTP